MPQTGRSRGGPSTEPRAIVEAHGLPVEVVITPGQASDDGPAEAQIEGRAGDAIIADRGYDADRVIELIERQGSRAVIPPRSHRSTEPRAFDAALYRLRHRIEISFNRLKHFRRVATRYGPRHRLGRPLGTTSPWSRSATSASGPSLKTRRRWGGSA